MRPIEEIAREAGGLPDRVVAVVGNGYRVEYPQWLTRFASIVRAEALEEAAEIADDMDYGLGAIAQCIRAMKDAPHA